MMPDSVPINFPHKLRSWLKHSLVGLYQRLFRVPPSETAVGFMRSLGWSMLSGGIASVVMMGMNIVSGRILGPTDYGTQNLILTIATLLSTLTTFGLGNASIHALSQSTVPQQRKNITSATLYSTSLAAVGVSIGLLLAAPWLREEFSLGILAIVAAAALAFVLTTKTILDGFIRGLNLFLFQSKVRLVEVALASILFLSIFFWFRSPSNIGYIWVLTISGAFVCALYLIRIRPFLGKFHLATFASLFDYGKVLFLGTVLGTLFNNFDRFLIAKYLSLEQLGLYSAYYAASTNLIAQLVQMFINVFFPTVSRSQNKLAVVQKVDRLFFVAGLPGALVLIGCISIIMLLFGKDFLFSIEYVVLFGALAVLQFFFTVYSFIITSIDSKAYLQLMRDTTVTNAVHLVAYAALVHFHAVTIPTIIWLYILNTSILIIRERRLLYQRLLLKQETTNLL